GPGGGFGGGAGGAPPAVQGGGIAMPAIGFGFGFHPNGLSRTVPVQFKKDKKETKSFKELSGTVEASLLGDAEAMIAIDKVMKQAGKSFKGGKGGEITINKVTKDKDGTISIEFTMELPDRQKAVPEFQVNIPIPADAIPAPLPLPMPVPNPNPGGKPV